MAWCDFFITARLPAVMKKSYFSLISIFSLLVHSPKPLTYPNNAFYYFPVLQHVTPLFQFTFTIGNFSSWIFGWFVTPFLHFSKYISYLSSSVLGTLTNLLTR